MKNITRVMLVTIAVVAIAAAQATAQENVQLERDPAANAASGTLPAYSQTESITQELPLDLLALNRPDELHGLAIAAKNGNELGRITSIARKNSDQSLHAIFTTSTGASAGVKLDELTLEALEYYDPARSLADQSYVAHEFEQISQYQTGHSAWGSLTNPTQQPTTTELDDESAHLAVAADANAERSQVNTAYQENQSAPASANANSAAQQQYVASGSSIVQLALTHADALRGKRLVDDKGTTVGEISHIAKNINDQQLYAVINLRDEPAQAAIKLDALAIGKLAFSGNAQNLLRQNFVQDDFTPLAGQ